MKSAGEEFIDALDGRNFSLRADLQELVVIDLAVKSFGADGLPGLFCKLQADSVSAMAPRTIANRAVSRDRSSFPSMKTEVSTGIGSVHPIRAPECDRSSRELARTPFSHGVAPTIEIGGAGRAPRLPALVYLHKTSPTSG